MPSKEVSVRVDLDRQARLAHPSCSDRVRLVLGGAPVRPVRARPAADRVQLLEALEDPAQSPKGFVGFAPVYAITLFVSR